MRLKLFEIVTDSDKIDINTIKNILDNKECIRDYAYILHDKDNTRPHYHIAVRLKDGYDTKYVAQWFGIGENFINKVKGRWSDMLKYLIHENAPTKFQYDKNEVISNFDWEMEKEKGDKRINEIVMDIVSGNIREYNYTEKILPLEYIKYKKSIDSAFKYRLDKIKGVERVMECIFITGDSGTGKTTYAKEIANNHNYSIYVSSGSNDILDSYQGQDCIILDDLRPSCLGLSDLLKMLDNNTASTVKSRYKNKVLECKLMIITTTLNIETFFNNVFSEEKETSIQLMRRCQTHIRMTNDFMYMKYWQNKDMVYSKEYKAENPVHLMHIQVNLTQSEIIEKFSNLLGDVKFMFDDVVKEKDKYTQLDTNDILDVSDNTTPFDKK